MSEKRNKIDDLVPSIFERDSHSSHSRTRKSCSSYSTGSNVGRTLPSPDEDNPPRLPIKRESNQSKQPTVPRNQNTYGNEWDSKENACDIQNLTFETLRFGLRADAGAGVGDLKDSSTVDMKDLAKLTEARKASGRPLSGNGVNVKVIVRCRPVLECDQGDVVLECREEKKEVVCHAGRSKQSKTFSFDGVCLPTMSQKRLFRQYVAPVIDEVLAGFNCTIFAYGQTGTGKTYTMEGDWAENLSSEPPTPGGKKELSFNLPCGVGVIPRSLALIFEKLSSMRAESSLRVSFLEIYNEELNDLLQQTCRSDLRIVETRSNIHDPRTNSLHGQGAGLNVQGLIDLPIETLPDVYRILSIATKKRKTAETSLNRQSSRSHSIFNITITMTETDPQGDTVIRVGKLNLVDLAGSENIQRSGTNNNKERAKEAGIINQSLVALGRCINALVQGNSYVPYRDSKLTRLLSESLGGKAKTCIIATVSPSHNCVDETLSTLDYAHRAKNIKNRPEINVRIPQKTYLREMTAELERLRKELKMARDGAGEIHLPIGTFEHLEKQSELLGQIKRDYQALYIRKEYLENELETLRSDLDGKNLQLLESDQQQTSLTVVLQDRLQLLNDLLLKVESEKRRALIAELRRGRMHQSNHLCREFASSLKMYADGSLAICDDFAKQLNHLHHTAVGVSQTLQDDLVKVSCTLNNDDVQEHMRMIMRTLSESQTTESRMFTTYVDTIDKLLTGFHNTTEHVQSCLKSPMQTTIVVRLRGVLGYSVRFQQEGVKSIQESYIAQLDRTEKHLNGFSAQENKQWTEFVSKFNHEFSCALKQALDKILAFVKTTNSCTDSIKSMKSRMEGEAAVLNNLATAVKDTMVRQLTQYQDAHRQVLISDKDSFAREVNDWLADFQEARSLFNSSLDVFVDRMTRQFPKTLEKSFNYEIPMTKLVDELVKTIVEPAIQTHLTSLQSTINLSAETSDQLCHKLENGGALSNIVVKDSLNKLSTGFSSVVARQNEYAAAFSTMREAVRGESLATLRQCRELETGWCDQLQRYEANAISQLQNDLHPLQNLLTETLNTTKGEHADFLEQNTSLAAVAEGVQRTLRHATTSIHETYENADVLTRQTLLHQSYAELDCASGELARLDKTCEWITQDDDTLLRCLDKILRDDCVDRNDSFLIDLEPQVRNLKGSELCPISYNLQNVPDLAEHFANVENNVVSTLHRPLYAHVQVPSLQTVDYPQHILQLPAVHSLTDAVKNFPFTNADNWQAELSKGAHFVSCTKMAARGPYVPYSDLDFSSVPVIVQVYDTDSLILQRFLSGRNDREQGDCLKLASLLALVLLESEGLVVESLTINELRRIHRDMTRTCHHPDQRKHRNLFRSHLTKIPIPTSWCYDEHRTGKKLRMPGHLRDLGPVSGMVTQAVRRLRVIAEQQPQTLNEHVSMSDSAVSGASVEHLGSVHREICQCSCHRHKSKVA